MSAARTASATAPWRATPSQPRGRPSSAASQRPSAACGDSEPRRPHPEHVHLGPRSDHSGGLRTEATTPTTVRRAPPASAAAPSAAARTRRYSSSLRWPLERRRSIGGREVAASVQRVPSVRVITAATRCPPSASPSSTVGAAAAGRPRERGRGPRRAPDRWTRSGTSWAVAASPAAKRRAGRRALGRLEAALRRRRAGSGG
jgi:hypothetical protein